MKVLKPKYEIMTKLNGMEELKNIERIARTCYKSEKKITTGSAEKMIRNLLKNGHEAMIEHSMLTVKFTIDRGVSHEFVRHRPASFAQESTRYVNYASEGQEGDCKFIDLKNALIVDTRIRKSKGIDVSKIDIDKILETWYDALQYAEKAYMTMIKYGASPQFARSVLPNSTKTELVITANFREWRHLLSLRTEAPAHPQMREVCIPLIFDLQKQIPIIFDDIIEKNELNQYMVINRHTEFHYDENGSVKKEVDDKCSPLPEIK